MARNETRVTRTHFADRAQLRAGACHATSWRALANVTVASTLVVAVVVSALALVESVLTNPARMLAQPSAATLQSLASTH